METLDHRTDPSILWRTIKAIDGKSPPKAENEAITFDDTQVSSPKQIVNYFNRQFTTSTLGRHTSSRETGGAYVGEVEEMMCVVCVDVTEGATL